MNMSIYDLWITQTPEEYYGYPDPHDALDLAAHDALLSDLAEQDAYEGEGDTLDIIDA